MSHEYKFDEKIAKCFRVLSNPIRFKIFMKILEEACECNVEEDRYAGNCVGDISNSLGLSQPTVSNHVKELVNCGLVEAKREGRKVYLFGSENQAAEFKKFGEYFVDEVFGHEHK